MTNTLLQVRAALDRAGCTNLRPIPGGNWRAWLSHFEATYEPPLPDCPLCGARLVQRSGKFGDFVGCSGYPDCRHTEAI